MIRTGFSLVLKEDRALQSKFGNKDYDSIFSYKQNEAFLIDYSLIPEKQLRGQIEKMLRNITIIKKSDRLDVAVSVEGLPECGKPLRLSVHTEPFCACS